ncbi:MAG TPA: cell division ATP-binding protein FtsE [bacterium]|nr:cell division ATP-binding protein FtsE [bacterium]
MISFRNVTKVYSNKAREKAIVALNNVSFEVRPGELVSIIGRSGAGKTTVLKLILSQEKPTYGEIFFDGEKLSRLKESKIPLIRRKIGTVFQDYKLLPSKTTYENVAYALEVTGADEAQIARDVPQLLDIVGLASRAENFPEELSAGERQRVAIARALVHRPKVILADEPTGNLDPYNTLDILRLFVKIHELGTTVILATHDKEVVKYLGRRVIVLEEGRLIRDEKKGKFIL